MRSLCPSRVILQAAGLENVTISKFSAPVALEANGGPRDIWKHCALSTPLGVSDDARGFEPLQSCTNVLAGKSLEIGVGSITQ